MKRVLFALTVLFLTASCAEKGPQVWDQEPVRFTATASGTRTLFSLSGEDALTVVWAPDDTIGIWCSGATRGNFPYVAEVSKIDASSALFNAVSEETMFLFDGSPCSYYAYYPWREGISAEPIVRFPVPPAQNQSAEGDVAHLAAMQLFRAEPVSVSAEGSQAEFHFTPAFATVRLDLRMKDGSSVSVPVRRIRLRSDDNPLSAERMTLDLSDPASLPVTDAGEREVSLGFGTLPVLDPDHAAAAFLTVLPGTHASDITAEVTAIDGSVASATLPAVTFSAGKLYSRSLSFDVEDFVQADPFDVQATSLTATAGEPLLFTISGSASGIGFFSGEKFHDYDYAEKDRIEVLPLMVSFKHALAAGKQNNHPLVKISSDYTGEMTETAILAATWTDISEHFTFATENLGSSNPITTNLETYNQYFVDSGEYDLAPHFASADSLYIAMFWHVDQYDSGLDNTRTVSYVTRFRVGDWEMSPAGLTFVWDAVKWSGVSASNVPQWQTPKNDVPNYPAFRFMSDFKPTADRDAYAVANQAFKSKKNYGPDQPVVVQDPAEETPVSYSYTFEEPGTYKVVFVASCPTLTGDKTEIRTFTVTVQ